MGPSGFFGSTSIELETQNLNFSFYCFSVVDITGSFGDTNHSLDDFVLVIYCHLTTPKQKLKSVHYFIVPHKVVCQEFSQISIGWFFHLRCYYLGSLSGSQPMAGLVWRSQECSCMWLTGALAEVFGNLDLAEYFHACLGPCHVSLQEGINIYKVAQGSKIKRWKSQSF